MSLQLIAKQMEAKGRKGDSMLVHMTPGEVAGLQKLAESMGGSLTVNPETGLVEANFLKQMLPTLVGAGVGFMTMNPMLGAAAGAAVGGYQARRADQDVGMGMLMGGLGGYGGATLGSGIQAAGATGAGTAGGGTGAVATNTAQQVLQQQAQQQAMQQAALAQGAELSGAEAALAGTRTLPVAPMATGAAQSQTAVAPLSSAATTPLTTEAKAKAFDELTGSEKWDRGLRGLQSFGTEEGRDAAYKAMGGSEGIIRALTFAGMPYLNAAPTEEEPQGIHPLLSSQINRSIPSQSISAYQAPSRRYTYKGNNVYSAAQGGIVSLAEGGAYEGAMPSYSYTNGRFIPLATQAVAPARPQGFLARMVSPEVFQPRVIAPVVQRPVTFADMGGSDSGQQVDPNPWSSMSLAEKNAYYAENPVQLQADALANELIGMTPIGALQQRFDPQGVAERQAMFGQAPSSVPVVDMSAPLVNDPARASMVSPQYLESTAPAAPSSEPSTIGGGAEGSITNEISAAAESDRAANEAAAATGDYGSDSYVAAGGLLSLAKGGLASGGFVIPADVVSMVGEGNTDAGYKRIKAMVPTATAIKGKDGGQSDTVKTHIDGKQRAHVAHGEMYIPPAAVKRMGGAKKLYAMMDRVRQQATGSRKQIRPVSLKKAMA